VGKVEGAHILCVHIDECPFQSWTKDLDNNITKAEIKNQNLIQNHMAEQAQLCIMKGAAV
jgi:hypothetical protein